MNNKKIIFIVSVFVLAVGLGLLLGVYILPRWVIFERPYYGVLLASGDFYVGRLNRLPTAWKLSDAFLLQSVADPANPEAQPTFSLAPVKQASIWAPDALMINPRHVIIWGRVGKQSEVMRVIDSPQNVPSGALQTPIQTPAPAPDTQ